MRNGDSGGRTRRPYEPPRLFDIGGIDERAEGATGCGGGNYDTVGGCGGGKQNQGGSCGGGNNNQSGSCGGGNRVVRSGNVRRRR